MLIFCSLWIVIVHYLFMKPKLNKYHQSQYIEQTFEIIFVQLSFLIRIHCVEKCSLLQMNQTGLYQHRQLYGAVPDRPVPAQATIRCCTRPACTSTGDYGVVPDSPVPAHATTVLYHPGLYQHTRLRCCTILACTSTRDYDDVLDRPVKAQVTTVLYHTDLIIIVHVTSVLYQTSLYHYTRLRCCTRPAC